MLVLSVPISSLVLAWVRFPTNLRAGGIPHAAGFDHRRLWKLESFHALNGWLNTWPVQLDDDEAACAAEVTHQAE
jgi:hypothetical protein